MTQLRDESALTQQDSETELPTIVYIVGTGRSGSTLVANLLGEAASAFSAGELRYLWRRAIVEQRICGCQKSVDDCEFWSEAFAESGLDVHDLAPRVDAELRHTTRVRRLLKHQPVSTETSHALTALYTAVGTTSGARVIVDSSKLPAYVSLLRREVPMNVRMLHVTRDPRATSFSWQRSAASTAVRGIEAEMHQIGTLKASVLWHLWNRVARGWGRRDESAYLHIRYEDLIADPKSTMERMGAFAGIPLDELPDMEGGQVQLQSNHTIAGNPGRFRSGPTKLKNDSEWQSGLSPLRGALVTALTSPLLRRLGYSYRWRA